jgi:flavin reductase (DIM6/NTAB) family NADH-FMN oxidoreductase RutF
MMGRLYYGAEELLGRPTFPGVGDPRLVYFHFRPARPANLLVTRDPDSGELNLAAGTFGPLTDHPYTICLHLHSSPHSRLSLSAVGAECVVALPGRDLVRETWIPALSLPRGICEAEVAELSLLPSRVVGVPGIAECPVNLECVVEFVRDLYGRAIAVFLKVLAANIDEEMLGRDRAGQIGHYPTYEVDDATNVWGGSIERLGVNGDLLECPGFPATARRGFNSDMTAWIADLRREGYLSEAEFTKLSGWIQELGGAGGPPALRERITRALASAAWEEWDDLHAQLSGK